MPDRRQHRNRRTLRRILITLGLLLALVLIAAASAFALFRADPADYHPRPLSPDQQQEAEFLAQKKAETFYNNTHRLQPFSITLEQDLLNNLLLLDDTQQFLDRHYPSLSRHLSRPQIAFHAGRLRLLATVTLEDRPIVLAVTLTPSLDEYGNLAVELTAVHAGRLPLPDSLVHDRLAQLADHLPQPPDTTIPADSLTSVSTSASDDILTILFDRLHELLTTGRTVLPARFRAVEDKSATITDLQLLPGRLQLSLDPTPLPD